MLQAILEAVFPARCIVCDARGTPLCEGCRRELPYLPDGLCQRCSSRRGARGVCHGCRRLSPAINTVKAAFVYEGAARSAVLTLKFRSGRYLAPVMGGLMSAELANHPIQADLIVPVPLAPGRLRRRGFNQAALLAEHVAQAVGGELVTNVLERIERPAQQTLSATARLSNLDGTLKCSKPTDVLNKRVLLVDDVVTTGATVSACADTLAQAGAGRISVLAFARDL